MDQVFEGTPKAEIRLTGRKVTRTAVTNDWGSRLQWKVTHDGKVIATPPARADVSYEHAEPTPGNYEIVLEMWKYEGYRVKEHGKFVEISNKVTYSV
jgi:hypothetical protein